MSTAALPALSALDWGTLASVASVLGAIGAAIVSKTVRRGLGAALHVLAYLDPLRGLKHNQALVMAELRPNGGSSMRDQVDVIRSEVTAMRETQGLNRAIAGTLSNLTTTLDAAPTDGDRASITDATACTFAAAVTGGGAVHCPVYYDSSSSSWKAG